MTNLWVALGALYGFLAVGSGAFAAHGLQDRVSERALNAVETGAEYALAHAVVLVVLGLMGAGLGNTGQWSAAAFAIGIAIFSGSLFVFGLTQFTGHLWMTPLGGLCLLGGWALLLFAALSHKTA